MRTPLHRSFMSRTASKPVHSIDFHQAEAANMAQRNAVESIRPLAQSESKARFMDRLGLDQNKAGDKRIYRLMKEEAAAGRHRMTDDDDVLAPDVKNYPSIEPPYTIAQICETAIHAEVLNIYRLASPETRPYYDIGRNTEGVAEENWVIRWLLWHVFRYRDARNAGRRKPEQTSDSPSVSQSPPSPGDTMLAPPTLRMYDAVRETWKG